MNKFPLKQRRQCCIRHSITAFYYGRVAQWSSALAWKARGLYGSESSNLSSVVWGYGAIGSTGGSNPSNMGSNPITPAKPCCRNGIGTVLKTDGSLTGEKVRLLHTAYGVFEELVPRLIRNQVSLKAMCVRVAHTPAKRKHLRHDTQVFSESNASDM